MTRWHTSTTGRERWVDNGSTGSRSCKSSDATAIKPFDIEFVGGRVLTVSMTLLADLSPLGYRFNLATGGVLTWRLDMHAGHEAEHAGPSHLQVGPSQNYRLAHAPVSLGEVADRVHGSLRDQP